MIGAATLTLSEGVGPTARTASGTFMVAPVAPGLFSVDASGQGLASAVALRVRADGSQSYEAIVRYDPMQAKFVAIPLDVSNPAEQVFLITYGTGIRGRSALAAVTATVGGRAVEVVYAGAQPDLAGLDQVNLRLPTTLAGAGEVNLVLKVDGKTANAVKLSLK